MRPLGAIAGAALVALTAGLALLTANGPHAQQQPPPPAPPAVTVAKPVQRTLVDKDEYVGRFTAIDAVRVNARVSGYLERIHFRDGQTVKQGDLLFSIDRRSFQLTVDQARANLQQAQANLAFAQADLTRAQTLTRERTISDQTFEQRVQNERTARATVAAQEAALRQAELDLEFTELKAPIAGRIGDRRVSVGNLVIGGSQATGTLLATIVSLDPIYFEFTVDEASYLRYQRLIGESRDIANRELPSPVELKLIDEPDFKHQGRLDFVDNVIDQSTGTIRLRARFNNPGLLFTPGMFGRIRVPSSPPKTALLVPDVAIGTEQVRKFVLVVGADNVARPKYVTLGPVQEGLRVVREGLEPEDRVIINGLARVRPGMTVTPQDPPSAPAGPPPPPRPS